MHFAILLNKYCSNMALRHILNELEKLNLLLPQKSSTNQNQPIGEQLASEGKTQFRRKLASEIKVVIESKITKINKAPLKQIAAIIQSVNLNVQAAT